MKAQCYEGSKKEIVEITTLENGNIYIHDRLSSFEVERCKVIFQNNYITIDGYISLTKEDTFRHVTWEFYNFE